METSQLLLTLTYNRLLRAPLELTQLTWFQGEKSIPEGVTRQARMVRFTALALRNGATRNTANISHSLTSFGLIRNGCKMSGDILPSADTASATLSFAETVDYAIAFPR